MPRALAMSGEALLVAAIVLITVWTLLLRFVDRQPLRAALRTSTTMFGLPLLVVGLALVVFEPEQVQWLAVIGLAAFVLVLLATSLGHRRGHGDGG